MYHNTCHKCGKEVGYCTIATNLLCVECFNGVDMTTILNDERPIVSIVPSIENRFEWQVGQYGITKIEPYREDHGINSVLWFNIWKGDILTDRVNGKYIDSIHYGDKK